MEKPMGENKIPVAGVNNNKKREHFLSLYQNDTVRMVSSRKASSTLALLSISALKLVLLFTAQRCTVWFTLTVRIDCPQQSWQLAGEHSGAISS